MKFTYEDYKSALKGVGPKLKDHILDRAINDPDIDFPELKALVDYAYPDWEVC